MRQVWQTLASIPTPIVQQTVDWRSLNIKIYSIGLTALKPFPTLWRCKLSTECETTLYDENANTVTRYLKTYAYAIDQWKVV